MEVRYFIKKPSKVAMIGVCKTARKSIATEKKVT